MKKASILSFQFADNYGAVLQIYALSKVLSSYNLEVEVIDFNPPYLLKPYSPGIDLKSNLTERGTLRTVKDILNKIKEYPLNSKRRKNFNEFRKTYLNLTKNSYKNETDLELDNTLQNYDYYFVGSDQVWNPRFFKYAEGAYFLNFANQNSIKASYAASIAEKLDSKSELIFRNELINFDYISVREISAKNDIKHLTDKNVSVTLDPTLLLDKNDWFEIATETSIINDDFILVYDLIKDERIISVVNELVEKTGFKVVSFSQSADYLNWHSSFMGENPTVLLKHFIDAKYVVTSSFHGTAFSLIFEKEFFTVPHPVRGSRMVDLLTSLDLESKLVSDAENVEVTNSIDYAKVNELMLEKKYSSINFLEDVINNSSEGAI